MKRLVWNYTVAATEFIINPVWMSNATIIECRQQANRVMRVEMIFSGTRANITLVARSALPLKLSHYAAMGFRVMGLGRS